MFWWQENTRQARSQDRRQVKLNVKACMSVKPDIKCPWTFKIFTNLGWHDGCGHEGPALCQPGEDRQGQVRLHDGQLRRLRDLLYLQGARQHEGRQVVPIILCDFLEISENFRQTISTHNIIVLRHEIFLATKHGVEAKNYEGLGDAAKLKPLEVIHMSHKCFQTASPNLSKLGRHCPAYMLVLWRLNMFSSRSNWRDSRICPSPLFRTLLTWGKERFVIDVLKSEII